MKFFPGIPHMMIDERMDGAKNIRDKVDAARIEFTAWGVEHA